MNNPPRIAEWTNPYKILGDSGVRGMLGRLIADCFSDRFIMEATFGVFTPALKSKKD